jgi:GNAT superfamily N-acetyltransferase
MSHDAYRASIASVLGVDPAIFMLPGTSVHSSDERRGTRLASHYRVGEHSVVWCDPAVVESVLELDGRPAPLDIETLAAWAARHGATRVGAGYDHVLAPSFRAPDRPGAVTALDPSSAAAVDLVADLLDACSEDDRDEAEFELEALDPHLVGWLEHDRLLALAGARPWVARPGFLDIGVITHPAARRRGLGRAVVAEVAARVLIHGRLPLYRCNADNVASWRLCRSVGFEVAVEIEAYLFPDEP